ncbi:transmembrane protein 244-like isoform X2 [Hyla sarda]|uniref:transmembrane protein 244-like isoform X2 n=2 Tax=Hyla sarda TaxID=327740 RepID=UPI0024C34DEF|nr:transmembrane protein 244-like isoform X2 [Hyla sarda]XP_056413228.1 transmembrane protein 244-like isoform X2 [Hyla sarda]
MPLGHVMNAGISLEKRNMNIHFHVFLCVLTFYTLFYMACSVCAGFMRIEDFDWMLPFRHTITPSLSSSQYLVHVISAGITFFLSGLLFVPVVGSMVWDYSATVIFVHVIVCCAVTQEFPLMWQWWVQIGCGLFLMILSGQTLAYFTCRNSSQRHISTI